MSRGYSIDVDKADPSTKDVPVVTPLRPNHAPDVVADPSADPTPVVPVELPPSEPIVLGDNE